MFFCEECRKKNMWPQSYGGSYGRCELCGNVDSCYDVPSKFLPIPELGTSPIYDKKPKQEMGASVILHLIGPNDHYTVNYWMEDEAPAVIYNNSRVWVKASYSYGTEEHRYFEQSGARYLPESFMTKLENPTLLQATEDDR